jgi:hypothetical protein
MKTPKAKERVAFRAYGDGSGGVILDLDTSLYFEVNRSGARIWQLIEQGLDISQIVDRIQSESSAPPNEVINDLDTFLQELAARSLVYFS